MLTMLANITAIVEKYKMSHYYEKIAAFVILVTLKQHALFAIYYKWHKSVEQYFYIDN
ncbi:hypothetical protein [Providencia hangzhouensis]|uniref:hypothetical protein n=1 Tax=Providencia hangzhouensis TaxID=3031799 RepID=UPI0034DD192A